MMTKTLHWCARRISDLGEALFDLGGSLELWCDERAERKRWVEYARDNESFPTPKAWLAALAMLDKSSFAKPRAWADVQTKAEVELSDED
jgi:hypothetical protein